MASNANRVVVHSTLYTLHSALYTLHSTLYTLHSTLYTLHSTLYNLHSTLYTLHSVCRLVQVWEGWVSGEWAGGDHLYPGLWHTQEPPGVPALAGQHAESQPWVSA